MINTSALQVHLRILLDLAATCTAIDVAGNATTVDVYLRPQNGSIVLNGFTFCQVVIVSTTVTTATAIDGATILMSIINSCITDGTTIDVHRTFRPIRGGKFRRSNLRRTDSSHSSTAIHIIVYSTTIDIHRRVTGYRTR